MSQHSIQNVPRYFETYVNDCFNNAYASLLLNLGQNPRLILADYLNFMYDGQNGYFGVNYLLKPNTTVEFTEEQLNTSYELIHTFSPRDPGSGKEVKSEQLYQDKINTLMYFTKDSDFAYSRTKELIDLDIPVSVAVDLHYIPYHRAYQKEHGLHYIVITGYNEEEGWYEIFDKYKLSSSDYDGKVPIKEVRAARDSVNPQNSAIIGDYTRPILNSWVEIKVGKDFFLSEKNIYNVLSESCERLSGEKEILGIKSGINSLDAFRKDILKDKESGKVINDAMVYKTYVNGTLKVIARSRNRFKGFINELGKYMSAELILELNNHLAESAKRWDICANLSLKFGITKSLALIDDYIKQIQLIEDEEKHLTGKLTDYLAGKRL